MPCTSPSPQHPALFRKTGQAECQRLLEEVQAADGRAAGPPLCSPADSITPEQRHQLEVYLATVDTDRVDADIILHIILYIHANLGQVGYQEYPKRKVECAFK